uniref:Ribonuclease H1 n=1 Tax=Geotrypetes seraphini TaxID=260995 RepID=A0A6P8PTX5_GEOSA|nr:ribonuclease H1-like [Geotrypetes seraphini]XP_033791693.1 ribonuclease H1-like [Geotrypetes seraphini]
MQLRFLILQLPRVLVASPAGLVLAARMYYAVRTGRKPGVYQTWDECKEQVYQFSSAKYKKFATEEEAWAFVNSGNSAGPKSESKSDSCHEEKVENLIGSKRPHQESSSSSDEEECKRGKYTETSSVPLIEKTAFTYMGDSAVVYTDGCCSCNGRKKARAGIGVYWGPGHPLNISDRLSGRQTNQRAEIQAACRAIAQAKSQNIRKLVLYTDSMFTINGITKWIHSWSANEWKLSTGKKVINKRDFKKLKKLTEGMDIKWIHIPGHAGFPGNEAADGLAREGARKPEK